MVDNAPINGPRPITRHQPTGFPVGKHRITSDTPMRNKAPVHDPSQPKKYAKGRARPIRARASAYPLPNR